MTRVNEADIEWSDRDRGETAFRRKQLSEATDGDRLGCSLYELPPGKASWPYHYHTANEEALYVLSGTGTLRIGVDDTVGDGGNNAGSDSDANGDDGGDHDDGDGDASDDSIETVCLEAGDYAAFPADEAGGHQVLNDGDEPLRYLAVSTMTEPDITVYPEMEKFGVYVGSPPGGRDPRPLEGYYRIDDDVDYWEE
jgi:uncharacterized cupin superfamily protein